MFSSLSSKVLRNLCNYKNVFADVQGSAILITLGHINTRFSRKLSSSSPAHVRTLRYLGQPTSQTHPHLVRPGEVTTGIQQEEFRQRRGQLMSAVKEHHGKQSRHVVIVVSSPVKYMAVDVPYPFRQDPNFLYLSGFKEPNSVLVLESCQGNSPTNHKATLLVPERNPERELWDGPRSGTDGALQLTGVDQTLRIDDLGRFLVQFRTQDWTVWFDHLKPVHRQLCDQIKTSLLQPRMLESKAPTQQVINGGELVLVDAGCEYHGYVCDITRTWPISGKFTEPQRQNLRRHQSDPLHQQQNLIRHQLDMLHHQQNLIRHQLELLHQQQNLIRHQLDLLHHQQNLIRHQLELLHHPQNLIRHQLDMLHHQQNLIRHQLELQNLIRHQLDLLHHQQNPIRHQLDQLHHQQNLKIRPFKSNCAI
uniref:Aminopeptidase P N-terminal domain-containing protein n=1 Tax=Branchiostoma floridae TaxID=7739 RepID=C3XXJ8_BRAFL|eukprot:XP_002611448.1 hypothetical protein BRAFLDRAFT_63920 [Branchiostoma floridae]